MKGQAKMHSCIHASSSRLDKPHHTTLKLDNLVCLLKAHGLTFTMPTYGTFYTPIMQANSRLRHPNCAKKWKKDKKVSTKGKPPTTASCKFISCKTFPSCKHGKGKRKAKTERWRKAAGEQKWGLVNRNGSLGDHGKLLLLRGSVFARLRRVSPPSFSCFLDPFKGQLLCKTLMFMRLYMVSKIDM